MTTKKENDVLREIYNMVNRLETEAKVQSEKIARMEDKFEKYVTIDRYKPVEMLTFGMVAAILLYGMNLVMDNATGNESVKEAKHVESKS